MKKSELRKMIREELNEGRIDLSDFMGEKKNTWHHPPKKSDWNDTEEMANHAQDAMAGMFGNVKLF